jgi:hypothetical protein
LRLSRQQPIDQKDDGADRQPSGPGFPGFGSVFVQFDRPSPAIRLDALNDDITLTAILHIAYSKQQSGKSSITPM